MTSMAGKRRINLLARRERTTAVFWLVLWALLLAIAANYGAVLEWGKEVP